MPPEPPHIRCPLGEPVYLPAGSLAVTVREIRDQSVLLEVDRSESNQPLNGLPPQVRHDIRNHLNTIAIGINLLRDELAAGDVLDAAETIEMIQEHLAVLTGHPLLNPS